MNSKTCVKFNTKKYTELIDSFIHHLIDRSQICGSVLNINLAVLVTEIQGKQTNWFWIPFRKFFLGKRLQNMFFVLVPDEDPSTRHNILTH